MHRPVVFLALLMGSLPAEAFELWGTGPLANASVQTTADTKFRYHRSGTEDPGRTVDGPFVMFPGLPVNDYLEQVGRYNMQITKGDLSIGLQFDEVALFSNRYVLDGELSHTVPLYDDSIQSPMKDGYFLIEKMFVKNRWEKVEVTVGDTYGSFGRGMALNIVKNTDLDIDTSIRGAKGVWRLGDVDVTAISGITNQQQISQENPNYAIQQNIPHVVSGGRVEWFGPISLGAHAATYKFARTAEILPATPVEGYGNDLDAAIMGANFEGNGLLGLDVYAEADLYDYRAVELTDGSDQLLGWATYTSVAAYPGKAVVLLEAKATKDTERITTFTTVEGWEPSSVPTLEYERVITEDGAAAVNSNDIMGTRIRVDYAAIPGEFTPYVAASYLIDNDTTGLHFNNSPENILHPMVGVEWSKNHKAVQFNAGHRIDQRQDAAEGADRMTHVDATIHIPLFGHEALEIDIDAKKFEWGVNEQQQTDFLEMANALAWHHGEKWIWMFYQDWTDNPLVQSEGNLGFLNKNLYGALEAQYKPGTNLTLKAFYGAYKAGIRCSGGQCRSLPGFSGARASLSGVF
jgi:hypothetical protein